MIRALLVISRGITAMQAIVDYVIGRLVVRS